MYTINHIFYQLIIKKIFGALKFKCNEIWLKRIIPSLFYYTIIHKISSQASKIILKNNIFL